MQADVPQETATAGAVETLIFCRARLKCQEPLPVFSQRLHVRPDCLSCFFDGLGSFERHTNILIGVAHLIGDKIKLAFDAFVIFP